MHYLADASFGPNTGTLAEPDSPFGNVSNSDTVDSSIPINDLGEIMTTFSETNLISQLKWRYACKSFDPAKKDRKSVV